MVLLQPYTYVGKAEVILPLKYLLEFQYQFYFYKTNFSNISTKTGYLYTYHMFCCHLFPHDLQSQLGSFG